MDTEPERPGEGKADGTGGQGGGDEGRTPRRPPEDRAPTTTGAIEIAMDAERHDPAPDSPARRVLLKHERLIEAQTAQLGRQRWRDFIVTALGLCVLGLAGLLVWDASRAHGVVVEPFAVPPDLAERGLSGHVLATQLLDRLTTLQAETVSIRAASTYANDWGGDVAVEIPNTGVSIGELRRYLRDWLGHQTRLSGEVWHLPDGRIVVTTRVGSNPGTRSEGTEAELTDLLQTSAEAIHAETQPYRHAVWLSRQDRVDEARDSFLALTRGGDENDRLWGYSGLATSSGSSEEVPTFLQAALRLRPDFTPARYNLAGYSDTLGREEQAYRQYTLMLDNRAAARRYLAEGRVEEILNLAEQSQALLVGDMAREARLAEDSIGLAGGPINVANAPLAAAIAHAHAHDLIRARQVLSENGLDTLEAMAARLELLGPTYEVEWEFARSIGDWATTRDRLIPILVLDMDADASGGLDYTAVTRADLAGAQARTGQVAEARATIAPTALNCAPCVRARGLIEAYGGNPRGADHWLGEAVRIAPSLPAGHLAWAEAYMVRRDAARAIEQSRLAATKGPNWADPHRLWGDALMLQNRPREAGVRYGEAVRLAPNWGQLHLALGRAQAAGGQVEAARASYRRAAQLELNPEDRTAVQALLRP
ncbi:MAG: hypothetical protein Q8S03_08225 [Brevundimonas sp.]|uniref:tetratricopeptide repeat protein n=1 Tax=Brevundimonas sp. TaxID=1871086 RepID=UPI002735C7E6|nr:tetratricopeptide repeat protein [Brevundimonas sp.]MDP3404661.1 hypothetical protein [Brevundimonas sp.]